MSRSVPHPNESTTDTNGARRDKRTARLPRPGDLSSGWWLATLFTWILVIGALAAVWNVSVQLGLSTWWLGPRGYPRPHLVQLCPFAAPAFMVLSLINGVQRLPWRGLVASIVVAAVGIGDLWRVPRLGAVELLIAAAAAAVSVASTTGVYRVAPTEAA